MFYRILLTALVISYVICVLVMSGMEREDLDVALLKKLDRYNINVNDLKNDTVRQECDKKAKAEEQSGDKRETDNTDAPKIQIAVRKRRTKDKLFTTKYAKIKTSQFELSTKINNKNNKQLKTETPPENPNGDMDYNKALSKPENVMKIMKLYTNLQNNIGRKVELFVNSDSNKRFTTDKTMLTTENFNNDDVQSFDINNSNENNLSRNTAEILNQFFEQNKLTLSPGKKINSLKHRIKLRKDNTVNKYLGLIRSQTSAEVTTAAPCCQVNNNIYSFNKFPSEISQGVEKSQQTHSTENNTSKNILYEIPEKVIQEITDKVRHKILNDLQKDNSSNNITKLNTITQDSYNDSLKDRQSKINISIEHTTRDETLMTPTLEVATIRTDATTTKSDCSMNKSDKKVNNTLNMLSDIKYAILKELKKDATTTSLIPTKSDQYSITNAFGDKLNAIPLNNLVCFVKSEILKYFSKASSNSDTETKKSNPNYIQNGFEYRINDIPYEFLKNLVIDIKKEILGNLKKESLHLNIETTTNSKEAEISLNINSHKTLEELMSKIKREMRKENSRLNIQSMTDHKITEAKSILNKIPYDVLKELVSKIEREMKKESHLNIETTTNDKITESRSIINKIPYDVLQELVSKIKYEMKKETSSLNIETTTNAKDTEAEGILNKMPYDVLQELISKIKYEMSKETSNLNIETTTHDKDLETEIWLNDEVLQKLISKIKREMTEDTSITKIETTTNYRNTDTESILNKIPYDVLQELTNKMKHEMRKETSNFDIGMTTNAKDTETKGVLHKFPNDIFQVLISNIKSEMKEDASKLNIESTTNDKDTNTDSILNKIPHDILQAIMSKIQREINKEISNVNMETTKNYKVPEMEINLHKLPLDSLQELVTKLKREVMRDLGKDISIPSTEGIENSTLLVEIDKYKSKVPNDIMKEIVAKVKNEILMSLRKEYVKAEATSLNPILDTETPENEVAKTPKDKLIDIMTNVKNEILRELKYDVTYSEPTTSAPVVITTETTTTNIGSMEYDKLAESTQYQEPNNKISQHTLQNIVNEVKNYVLKDIKPVNVYPNKFYKDIFQKIRISNVQKNRFVVKDWKIKTTTMSPMSTVEVDIKTPKNDLVLDKMLQVLNQLNTLKETIANKATTEENDKSTKITTENNENIVLPSSNMEVPAKSGLSVIIKPSPYSLTPKISDLEDNVLVQHSRRDPYVRTFSLSHQPDEKRVLIAETYQTNSDSIPPLGIPMRARPNPFHSLIQNQNIVVTSKPDIKVVRYDPSMLNNQKFQLNPASIPLVPQNFKYRPPLSHLDFEEYFANNNHIMGSDTYNQKSDVYDTPQQRQNPVNKYNFPQSQQPMNKAYLDPTKRNQNQYPFKFFQNQPFDQGLNIQLGYDYPQMQPDLAASIDRYQQSYRPSNNQEQRYPETPRFLRPKPQQGVYRKVENKKKYLRTRDAQTEPDQDRNRGGDIIDSRERDRKVNSIEKRISKVTRVPKRKQESLKKRPSTYDDAHFKNFLKTQQKVNQMLEKILSTKKAVNSVELLKKR